MNFDNDFPQEGTVEIIVGKRKFEYKPLTTGEEFDNLKELGDDFTKNAYYKLTRVLSCPYTKERIKKILGIDKEYSELNNEQKIAFWRKLRPSVTTKVLEGISKIELGESEELKNSSTP